MNVNTSSGNMTIRKVITAALTASFKEGKA